MEAVNIIEKVDLGQAEVTGQYPVMEFRYSYLWEEETHSLLFENGVWKIKHECPRPFQPSKVDIIGRAYARRLLKNAIEGMNKEPNCGPWLSSISRCVLSLDLSSGPLYEFLDRNGLGDYFGSKKKVEFSYNRFSDLSEILDKLKEPYL